MKTLLLTLFILISASVFSQTKTITMRYDHHEILEHYCFTVFKNNDKSLTFFNPSFGEYGGKCVLKEEYVGTYFTIEYRPHGSNPKYSIMLSFTKAAEEDVRAEADYPGLTCTHEEEKLGQSDTQVTNECSFKNARFKAVGVTDYKDRTYWEYQVFELADTGYVETSNSNIFNDKQKELTKRVNEVIKEEYSMRYHAQDSQDCFRSENSAYFSLNSMNIIFEGEEIVFVIDLGLTDDCAEVNFIHVPIPMSEAEQYFK